jgi:hypothetical protein
MDNLEFIQREDEFRLSGYPFVRESVLDGLFVEATFVQFLGVPVLSAFQFGNTLLQVTISFEEGEITSTLEVSLYQQGARRLIFRRTDGTFLGVVVFGEDVLSKFQPLYFGKLMLVSEAFSTSTTTHVHSDAGIFKLNSFYGDIVVRRAIEPGFIDERVFFTKHQDYVTINCVYGHKIPTTVPPILKQVNGITPTNNAIFFNNSELLKFKSSMSPGSLNISIAGSEYASVGNVI